MRRLIRYQILKITDKDHRDRLDGRYPLRIGRKCLIDMDYLEPGFCLFIQYDPDEEEDYKGVLPTSTIESCINADNKLQVTTKNSIYYFKLLN